MIFDNNVLNLQKLPGRTFDKSHGKMSSDQRELLPADQNRVIIRAFVQMAALYNTYREVPQTLQYVTNA